MTIAAGFFCVDGIVLAADSQYSGGVAKTSGQKIFPICQNARYSVTLAGAGHVGTTKRTVDHFTILLNEKIGNRDTTIGEIRGVLEDALCAVHEKHVYPAPASVQSILDFWLLMAVWTPTQSGLFRSDVTAVNQIHGADCIGIGSFLGNYLIDTFCEYSPLMHVEDVKPIAAYIIKSAKDYVDGCGLNTFVHVLTDKGIAERVPQDEIKDAEDCYTSLFKSVRQSMWGPLNVKVPAGDLASISDSFAAAINEFRESQTKRIRVREAREQQRAQIKREWLEKQSQKANPEASPNPQPPTTDQ